MSSQGLKKTLWLWFDFNLRITISVLLAVGRRKVTSKA